MRNYILARKGWSWLSGRALARYFRANGYSFYVTGNPGKKNIIVNWGNSSCINAVLNQNISTNKSRQIRNLSNAGINSLRIYKRNPPRDEICGGS